MDCKKCGRCCRELKLEIMEIDLMRDERLRAVAVKLPTESKNPFEQSYILPNPCPFQVNNECIIYDTRPNICVAFLDKCLSK